MVDYYELREKLEHELESEVAKIHGEMTSNNFCTIKDLLCAIQYAATIPAMDEASEGEGSGYSQRMPYGQVPGNSYARGGRMRNARGQYSGSYRPYYPIRYSRDDGREHMMSQLESMMNEAPTERAREAIRRAMEALEME